MKNAIRNRFYSLTILVLLGQTCAKENEAYIDEDQNYVETMYRTTKKEAQSDWKEFYKNSSQVISVTERNLNAIETKIKNTNSNRDKEVLKKVLNTSRLQLDTLKGKLKARNLEFESELKHYETSSAMKNKEFRNNFQSGLQALNTRLEAILGEED